MTQKSRSTFKKRQKEIARQQRRQDKLARRQQRTKEREEGVAPAPAGEDPDIAGIVPGPQPPPDGEM
jgi:hypothetical protein